MQSRTTTFDGDAALLWQPVRVRKTRKTRVVRLEIPIAPAVAPHPGGIRPEIGDALELVLFITTLGATGLLHLGVLALMW